MSTERPAVHAAAMDLLARVSGALNGVLPPGFRGKLEIVVDGHGVEPHNCAVQFRPSQPKAGMTGGKP